MERASQKKKVLNHLQTHRCITSMDAIYKYRATRLSAIIFDLRKEGYAIKTEIVTRKNEDGNTINYAEYSLIGEENV